MKTIVKFYALTCVGIAVFTVLFFAIGQMTFPSPDAAKKPLELTPIPKPSPTPSEKEILKSQMEREFASIYLSTNEPVSDREKLVKDLKSAFASKPSKELDNRLSNMGTAYDYVGLDFRNFIYHEFNVGKARKGKNTYRCTLTGSKIGIDGEYVSQDDYKVVSDIDEHNKICVDLISDTKSSVNPEIRLLISRIENGEFSPSAQKEDLPDPIQKDEPVSALVTFFSTPTWSQFFGKPFLIFSILAAGVLIQGLAIAFGINASKILGIKLIRYWIRRVNKPVKLTDPEPASLFD